ncbi:MAG: amino acid transporter [Alphaproteobacteria bacterium]|nr:amino acid transporter [Alphaproteobacteria bacterium]
MTPQEVASAFASATFPWWIAGGYAIEHFVGRPLRPHGDIDILLLRADHAAARALLARWDCWMADPPGTLRPWREGDALPPHVSDVWCREPGGPWRFQLMFDDSEGVFWRSRRCAAVTRPISELGTRDSKGIPFLASEVQLFYKAKMPRPRDEVDFAAAWPLLSAPQKTWLRQAIIAAYGPDNLWLTA